MICHLDGLLYHGKCFKFDNDTALDIQQQSDWTCPDCLDNIYPLRNEDFSNKVTVLTCTVCIKLISNSRHKIITCTTCNNIVHSSCSSGLICNSCDDDSHCLLQSPHFNPYDFGDCEDNEIYNDDFELYVDSITTASSILENCNYVDMENFNTHFQNYLGKSYTSVYFQNIDGTKTNFDEFILNYHKLHYDFDFVAFAETNIHYDEINQFSLNNSYNCQVLSKKLNKQKGSGIILYIRHAAQN